MFFLFKIFKVFIKITEGGDSIHSISIKYTFEFNKFKNLVNVILIRIKINNADTI
jgi:hypothetical protein